MLDGFALAALNHLLQGADWARTRLKPFAGRTARLSAPPLQLDLVVDVDGYLAETGCSEFDVRIELPANLPLNLLGGSAAFEQALKAAQVSGSADFANVLGFVLQNLRWDYEEDLSKVVGDIAAHRIAGQFRSLVTWQKQAARNLAENFVEYCTEEQPVLAKPSDTGQFKADVQRLDTDIASLEQRITRLAKQPA